MSLLIKIASLLLILLNLSCTTSQEPQTTGSSSTPCTPPAVTREPPPSLDLRPLHTEEGAPIVYFTFDDGPTRRETVAILDLFAQYNAHATFFVLGSQVIQAPEVVYRAAHEGHTIGNHSYSHPALTGLSPDDLYTEVECTQEVLVSAADIEPEPSRYLRPPFGSIDDALVAFATQHGYTLALWTFSTEDWNGPTADQIVATVRAGLEPGAIILMHDGGGDRGQTVAALQTLLPELTGAGYVLRGLEL